MGMISERILGKIEKSLAPQHLELIDNSHKHAGHGGAHPEGETHFHLKITSSAFEGQTQLQRQRHVYTLLAEELKERVHALELSLRAPSDV